MKVQNITKEYVLFDNGKKLTFEFSWPAKTTGYRYYVDLPALIPQMEGKELEGESCIFDGLVNVKASQNFDGSLNFVAGFLLKFGNRSGGERYFVPLYKKVNPDYEKLDLERVCWALDCTPEQMEQPDFDRDGYAQTLKQLELWKRDCNRLPERNLVDGVSLTVKYGGTVLKKLDYDSFLYLPCQYAHSEEPVHYDPKRAMKIVSVTDTEITFSNGKKITFDHKQDCCENNYADFEQIDDLGRDAVYYENELIFEAVEGAGFRFGNRGGNLTFIPCYSEQNGYYTTEIDIFYGGRAVLHLENTECVYNLDI